METATTPAASTTSAPSSTSAASAPASTPATSTSTSTPAAAPASTTTTPAAAPKTIAEANADPRSTEEILRAKLSAPAATETKPADGETVTPVDETLANEGDTSASADETNTGEVDQNTDLTANTPKELTEMLEAYPDLKQLAEANPELKGELYDLARQAAETSEYRDVVGSPDEARMIAGNSQTYTGLQDGLASVDLNAARSGDYKSLDAFIDGMVAQTYIRDENGELVKDAQGNSVSDNSVGQMFMAFFLQRMDIMRIQADKAEGGPNDQVLEALDVVAEFAGLKPKQGVNVDDLPEEMRQERQRLDQQKEQLQQESQRNQEQAKTSHYATLSSNINAALDKSIGDTLSKATGLSAENRASADAEIRKALSVAIKKSQFNTELKNRVKRMPYGPARLKAHTELATKYNNVYLPRVAKPIMERYGVNTMTKEEQRLQREAARSEAARSESKGSLGGTQAQQNSENSIEKVTADLKAARGGKEPSTEEIIAERIRRLSK